MNYFWVLLFVVAYKILTYINIHKLQYITMVVKCAYINYILITGVIIIGK